MEDCMINEDPPFVGQWDGLDEDEPEWNWIECAGCGQSAWTTGSLYCDECWWPEEEGGEDELERVRRRACDAR